MECATAAYRGTVPGLSDNESSDSDSDGDCWKRSKPKTSPKPSPVIEKLVTSTQVDAKPQFPNQSRKRKANNIWSSVLEEQSLTSVLGQCGLKKNPITLQNRACESYDFRRKLKDPRRQDDDDNMDTDNKRVKHMDEITKEEAKKRRIKLKSSDAKVAEKIIYKLGEKKPHLIFRIVYFIGVAKAMELLAKTENIEDEGGMQVKNNSRRRTPGGVYIQLLKSDKDIPKSRIDSIFAFEEFNPEDRKKASKERKKLKRRIRAKQKEKMEEKRMEILADCISTETVVSEEPPSIEPSAAVSSHDDNSEVEDGEVVD